MGWKPVGFSEIEKFPSQVLAHHYPTVTNFGDMTKYKEWKINDPIGLLVGGTPCQSFSVAGLRKGLDDPRGNLALTYLGILDKFRPKWCVWENVPGVLSSGGGRDFGSFLGALGELGYGFAYRVLDAQNFGVAQRRRRVFVVGCLGDWRAAAEVLFESDCLRGDIKKGRKEGQDAAAFTASSFGNYGEGVGTIRATGGDLGGGSETLYVPDVANCLQTTCDDYSRADGFNMIAKVYENHPSDFRINETNVSPTVRARWGTGGGNIPLTQNVAFGFTQCDAARDVGNNISPTLRSGGNGGYPSHSVASFVDTYNGTIQGDVSATMTADMAGPTHSGPKVMQNMAVRRLTPVECERLQGFPDNYTNIKDKCPDGPRYKAMGNSMAVPVMRWIGERINMVNNEQ
jgi:DNA (cytosine-5)-methyltransferase 1